MNDLRKKKTFVKGQDTTLDVASVLSFKQRIFVPRVDDLSQNLLEKSHCSPYSVHLSVTKMYSDLKRLYFIVMHEKKKEFVTKCHNCHK